MDIEPTTPTVQARHEFTIVSSANEAIATATVERMHGVLWLTNVWTHHKYRRRGYARLILETVMATVAEELWLKVYPYTDRPMAPERLAAFYGSFGFEPTDVPGVMVRRPR